MQQEKNRTPQPPHSTQTHDWQRMQAFVCFEPKEVQGMRYYQAWYQPEFQLERACAAYFRDRFPLSAWAVTTPRVLMVWTGSELIYEEGYFSPALANWRVKKLMSNEQELIAAPVEDLSFLEDLQNQILRNFSDPSEDACLGA